MSYLMLLDECQVCGALEERTFTDSWTGKEFCITCLAEIIEEITFSPASEGDNLEQVMRDHDMWEDDEDDEDF